MREIIKIIFDEISYIFEIIGECMLEFFIIICFTLGCIILASLVVYFALSIAM